MSFQLYLKDLRSEYNYTQKEIADVLGVNLETIKKIESNKTKMPSKSLIDSLAKLTNQNKVRVVSDIIFKTTMLKEYDHDPQHFKDYCAVKYFEGWNVVNLNYGVDLNGLDLRQFSIAFSGWKLVSKLNSTKTVLVIPASREIVDQEKFINDPYERIEFGKKLFGYAAYSISPSKELQVVFNMNEELEKRAYEIIKKEKREASKVPVYAILYNSKEYCVGEQVRIL